MPLNFHLDSISNLLIPQYFPQIIQLDLKQASLIEAIKSYCFEFAGRNTVLNVSCSGYPPDPVLPPQSIFNGVYSSKVAGEPVNPYTNDFNCKSGYDPVESSIFFSANNTDFVSLYMCINKTQNKVDAMNYFGGMYTNG
eukprot:319935_1